MPSPNHAIYVRDVLIPVYCLRNDMTVMQLDRDSIDYFHLELQTHDIVLAEGLPVESYLDCGNRSAEMSGYAPLVLRGPEVEATRMHLFTRAAALAHATEAFAGSTTI